MRFLVLISLLFSLPLVARSNSPTTRKPCEWTLYHNGERNEQSFEALKSLQGSSFPCTLRFSKQVFEVEKLLGQGGGSFIFLTSDKKALRVNKRASESFDEYLTISNELRKRQIPIVRVYPSMEQAGKHEFLLLEVYKREKWYSQFQAKYYLDHDLNVLNSPEDKPLYFKFLWLVGKLSPFTYISDLHMENIVLTDTHQFLVTDFGGRDAENPENQGKPFTYFSWPEAAKPIVVKWIQAGESDDTITKKAHEQEWWLAVTQNVILDADKSIWMWSPKPWHEAIREASFKGRLEVLRKDLGKKGFKDEL